jgi:hypothetical protein
VARWLDLAMCCDISTARILVDHLELYVKDLAAACDAVRFSVGGALRHPKTGRANSLKPPNQANRDVFFHYFNMARDLHFHFQHYRK